MLEVPHQGRWVEKADGGDAQTGLGLKIHAQIEYQSRAGECARRTGLINVRAWAELDIGVLQE
jgi:hypothetical protein